MHKKVETIAGIARQVAAGLVWITAKTRNKLQKRAASMDMAACNNCSLKEKEQVYTAARDGNHLYLKVSRDEKDIQRLTSPLPKPALSDELFAEP